MQAAVKIGLSWRFHKLLSDRGKKKVRFFIFCDLMQS